MIAVNVVLCPMSMTLYNPQSIYESNYCITVINFNLGFCETGVLHSLVFTNSSGGFLRLRSTMSCVLIVLSGFLEVESLFLIVLC